MEHNADLQVSGTVSAPTGDFATGLTVSGSAVSIGASVGGGGSRAFITLAVDQSTNINAGDHVEFDVIGDDTGDISLATGVGQADGLITLPEGKFFHLRCSLRLGFSNNTGLAEWQWRNNTDAVLIGKEGEAVPPISLSQTPRIREAEAFINTVSGTKEVEVRINTETVLTGVDQEETRVTIVEI